MIEARDLYIQSGLAPDAPRRSLRPGHDISALAASGLRGAFDVLDFPGVSQVGYLFAIAAGVDTSFEYVCKSETWAKNLDPAS